MALPITAEDPQCSLCLRHKDAQEDSQHVSYTRRDDFDHKLETILDSCHCSPTLHILLVTFLASKSFWSGKGSERPEEIFTQLRFSENLWPSLKFVQEVFGKRPAFLLPSQYQCQFLTSLTVMPITVEAVVMRWNIADCIPSFTHCVTTIWDALCVVAISIYVSCVANLSRLTVSILFASTNSIVVTDGMRLWTVVVCGTAWKEEGYRFLAALAIG